MNEIVDTEFLQLENDRSEIATKNFRMSLFFQLFSHFVSFPS